MLYVLEHLYIKISSIYLKLYPVFFHVMPDILRLVLHALCNGLMEGKEDRLECMATPSDWFIVSGVIIFICHEINVYMIHMLFVFLTCEIYAEDTFFVESKNSPKGLWMIRMELKGLCLIIRTGGSKIFWTTCDLIRNYKRSIVFKSCGLDNPRYFSRKSVMFSFGGKPEF